MTRIHGVTHVCLAAAFAAALSGTSFAQSGHHQHDTEEEGRSTRPDRAQQGHGAHKPAPAEKPPDLPPVTDEDRRAAFPDVEGHTVHDTAIHYLVLFDTFEWQRGEDSNGLGIETNGWIGGDINRFWFRVDGKAENGDVERAQIQALYGRAIARWWEFVAGVRQDVRPGPAHTWVAAGIQGLAPHWFDVEVAGYVGESGRTHLRTEAEYDLLLTNRVILQPAVEVDIYGKDIPESGIGAGVSSTEAGLRLRYEIRREVAPYVGVIWTWKHGGTADAARAEGQDVRGARLALGVRLWF